MSKLNIEQSFITEILSSGDMTKAIDNHINLKLLTGTNKKAFIFIRNHFNEYSKVPSIKVFKKKFPSYILVKVDGKVGTGENLQYWCDELRVKYKHNTMVSALEGVVDKLENFETLEAFKQVKSLVDKIENDVITSSRLELGKDTHKRKEAYLKRQKSGGMTGLPTGIEHWDNITGGLNDEELTAIMGFTGVGKSWLLLIIAVNLVKLGYRVLFFTVEMSPELVMRRFDAIWCGLNYTNFKKGQLEPTQQKKYFKYLEEQEEQGNDNFIVEQVTDGLPQVSARIDQYSPDVVLVDGAYLMADEEDDNWLATLKIFRGLHKLVLSKKKPIVATTQSKDEVGATLKSLQFSKMLAQDCDIVAVLEQDEQMKNDKEAVLRPLKLREGSLLSSVYMNWDFDDMNYSSIFSEEVKKDSPSKEEAQGVIDVD